MQSVVEHIGEFITRAGHLAETKAEILALKTTRKISVTIADLLAKLSIAAIVFLVMIMSGIGASLWLGSFFENMAAGFFAVAGFYLLVGLVLYVFRKSIFIRPLRNYIIKKTEL